MEVVDNMMSVSKYPVYKDSGVPWVGTIPSHWLTEKGKWLFVKNERPIGDADEIVTCFRDGEVTLRSNRRTAGFTNALKEHGYQGVRKGDLVIHAMDAFAGAIGVSDSDGKSTPVYSVCTARNKNSVNHYYYAYYLRNLALNGVIVSLAKGIRERSTDFRFKDFGDLILAFPPFQEQTAIANFLDDKTSNIDRAIAQKEQMILLLKERKQIIIQNAVTKGLDPNVKMKDSGVDWIGEIPEHWEVLKFKQIFAEKKKRLNGKLPAGAISYGIVKYKSENSILESTKESYQEVLKGEFLINPLNLNYDLVSLRIALSEIDVVVSSGYIVLNEKNELNRNYMRWLLHRFDISQMKLLGSGVRQTISFNHLANELLVLPSKKEQQFIESYINDKLNQIDSSISLQLKQIEKLKDYKATLIDSAVTGKIRVC